MRRARLLLSHGAIACQSAVLGGAASSGSDGGLGLARLNRHWLPDGTPVVSGRGYLCGPLRVVLQPAGRIAHFRGVQQSVTETTVGGRAGAAEYGADAGVSDGPKHQHVCKTQTVARSITLPYTPDWKAIESSHHSKLH
jgi:hypothetical protein